MVVHLGDMGCKAAGLIGSLEQTRVGIGVAAVVE